MLFHSARLHCQFLLVSLPHCVGGRTASAAPRRPTRASPDATTGANKLHPPLLLPRPAFGLGAAYALWHAMVLIRTGYAWAVVWQGRSQDGGRLYKLGLVGSIVGFFAGVVVLTVGLQQQRPYGSTPYLWLVLGPFGSSLDCGPGRSYTVFLTLQVLMLMFFNRPTGCEVNLFFIIFNAAAFVLLLVGATALARLRHESAAGLSGAHMAHCTFPQVLALLPSIRAKNGIAAVLTTGLVCFLCVQPCAQPTRCHVTGLLPPIGVRMSHRHARPSQRLVPHLERAEQRANHLHAQLQHVRDSRIVPKGRHLPGHGPLLRGHRLAHDGRRPAHERRAGRRAVVPRTLLVFLLLGTLSPDALVVRARCICV